MRDTIDLDALFLARKKRQQYQRRRLMITFVICSILLVFRFPARFSNSLLPNRFAGYLVFRKGNFLVYRRCWWCLYAVFPNCLGWIGLFG